MDQSRNDPSITDDAPLPITVRATKVSDAELLLQILQHPKVQPFQLPVRKYALRKFKTALKRERTNDFEWWHHCICHNETIIGHTEHLLLNQKHKRIAMSGWNLHPDYWGKGIMMNVLCPQFDFLFEHRGFQYSAASCFKNNLRCIRLMEKVGFKQSKMGWLDQCVARVVSRSWQKYSRFKLLQSEWQANQDSRNALLNQSVRVDVLLPEERDQPS